MTDKDAADCSKAVCWGVKLSIGSYNNRSKVSIFLIKAQFLFIQENK